MKQTVTIDVVTRLQDNGDGGYTMYIYNNNQELLDDHPVLEYLKKEKESEEYKQKVKEILDEYDPYENGYIGSDTIEVEIEKDGTARLSKPLSFHAGQ